MQQRFIRHKEALFYALIAVGGLFLSLLAVAIQKVFTTLWLYSQALVSQREVICGCELTLSFTDQPYLLTGLFIAGGGLVLFLSFVIARSFLIITRTRRFIKSRLLLAHKLSAKTRRLSKTTGLAGKVVEFVSTRPEAFCFGYLQPRIAVSTATVAQLTTAELEAVFLHEKTHLSHREPLKLFLLKVLSVIAGTLPGVKRFIARYVTLAELTADQAAVTRQKTPRHLARALTKMISRAQYPALSISHFASTTDYRIELLAQQEIQLPAIAYRLGILLGCMVAVCAGVFGFFPVSQASIEPGMCHGQAGVTPGYQCRLIEQPACTSTIDPVSSWCG